ncbi:hypothetical protein [Streptomyces avidinii]|uniref:Uncharacterized protein n=1 Tax=Streptomyces avidinii TaxID=1895 RepID=A0ABS4KXM3_STRAV|nr:hypothetical protein [Streptomyces avidinii]MBP2034226.1 hypothetical protein [Streptomyces avidinii]
MFVALAGTEEVVQELGGRRPARRLLRHHERRRLSRITAHVAASTRATAPSASSNTRAAA